MSRLPGLTLIYGCVEALAGDENRVTGIEMEDGTAYSACATVLTTGTFLNGTIHIGDVSHAAGRWGDENARGLATSLRRFDLPLGRLKTGTPPRLDGRTIDWSRLDRQPGDDEPTLFSYLSTGVSGPQISCGITHTNPETHDIIRENLSRSAMYGGHISGKGPRYCPSIEDKIDIPDSRKDDFRREILNFIGHLALEGKKFTYDTNDRLRRALEMKLFEDQKDTIKLTTLVSNVVDRETQEKIEVVKQRLIDNYGYNEESATDVLNYVASIFARGDAKERAE